MYRPRTRTLQGVLSLPLLTFPLQDRYKPGPHHAGLPHPSEIVAEIPSEKADLQRTGELGILSFFHKLLPCQRARCTGTLRGHSIASLGIWTCPDTRISPYGPCPAVQEQTLLLPGLQTPELRKRQPLTCSFLFTKSLRTRTAAAAVASAGLGRGPSPSAGQAGRSWAMGAAGANAQPLGNQDWRGARGGPWSDQGPWGFPCLSKHVPPGQQAGERAGQPRCPVGTQSRRHREQAESARVTDRPAHAMARTLRSSRARPRTRGGRGPASSVWSPLTGGHRDIDAVRSVAGVQRRLGTQHPGDRGWPHAASTLPSGSARFRA